VKLDKPFFVGQRSLAIVKDRPLRQTLVGFMVGAEGEKVAECHLAIDAGRIAGRVTSVAWSSTLDQYIGLAMLAPELAQPGGTFEIRVTDGSMVKAAIVPTPFYDAEGRRLRMEEAA
jgi:sarcosine oxidase subunit alpha